MTYCFSENHPSLLWSGPLRQPGHWHLQVCSWSLAPLPSPSFIPGEVSCPCLDFAVWKSNMRTAGWGRTVQQERPMSKLTTGCESVTLASTPTHSSFFFPFFSPLLLRLCTSSLEGKAEHLCVWNVRMKRDKPQSWLKTVKTHYTM